jgi:ribonuclease HI
MAAISYCRKLNYVAKTTSKERSQDNQNTRNFTVKSAYDNQNTIAEPIVEDWKSLWSWKGPHRIQTFMWMAAHERLLTNFRRSKWGVGASPTCSRCDGVNETTIHVLRDCPAAIQTWIRLVPSNQITNFFSSSNCSEWIFKNINHQPHGIQNRKWKTIFMVACWHMWKWRNKTIFEDDFQRPNDPTYVIIKMVEDIDKCIHHPLNIRHYDTIFIGWKRPREGWIKLNCDGAYKDSLGLAGCGGLFRDSDGRWIKGYSRKIGTCDALSAEMWGMYLGMQLAWRQGFHHLQVESDSKSLVDMITGKVKFNGNPPTLVRRIGELIKLNWQVQFNHTCREGNISADWMANFSFSLNSFNIHVMETPPNEVSNLLFADVSGACMPRNIHVIL